MATIELLIAFAILVINITGVILLTNSGQSISIDNQTNEEATAKAQTAIEEAKNTAREDFNLLNSIPLTDDDIYEKELQVTSGLDDPDTDDIDESLFTKLVTSIIEWPAEGGRMLKIQFQTLISNPDAVDGGDTCSSVFDENEWLNPQKTEYEFGDDILDDTSSGFPISSIQTFNHKMYVTVNNDNGNNPGTFFILDVSDPENTPVLLSPPLFDNSPVGEGLNGVAVDGGDYAYVASGYTSAPAACLVNNNCAQLQVIDISNSASPAIVKNFKINSVATGNRLAAGKSIFYKDGIVYLGLTKATAGNDEFFVIDVGGGRGGGSPTNPVILDSAKIDNGINSIFVRGDYAYVASPNNEELKIFDISTPTSISEVGGFDAPGGGANNGNGKSLFLVGSKLYFGRTLLNGNEFYILNNTNPATNLPALGSKNIQNGDDGHPPAPFNTTISGIIVRHNLAFLITDEEFQTWNISNPSNITEHADPLLLPPGGGGLQGTATDCEGNYIFVGSQGSNDKGYISVITGS